MTDSNFGNDNLCGAGHLFLFAGSMIDGKVSEGYPCACGLMKAHYVKCKECGNEKLEAVPV